MIRIGNFFFKYRNRVFILFYAALFLPSPRLFSPEHFGIRHYAWPILTGLLITVSGQLIRGLTIGLVYIVRGGRQGKPFAEDLVTQGIFHHCRNPLYVGNILMLLGIGILANSLLFVVIFIPLFIFIYQSIVLAEEDFLRRKFGMSYEDYCRRVNRWWPDLRGIGTTLRSMRFNWRRWILREHSTQLIWLLGITTLLLLNYPEITGHDRPLRNRLLVIIPGCLLLLYGWVRLLKKTKRLGD